MESKAYSWAWVTADMLLSHGPCELHFAQLTADDGVADVTLYDGENTSGQTIFTLKDAPVCQPAIRPDQACSL